MKRYEWPYISDGVKYSAVIWARSEAEAAEKMRALPWAPGSGPLPYSSGSGQSMMLYAALVLAVVVAGVTAVTFNRADKELKQMAQEMHLKQIAYPSDRSKVSHRV